MASLISRFLTRPAYLKMRMAGYLGLLFVLASWAVGDLSIFARGLGIVALYVVADVAWAFLKDRTWYLPTSSVISGFIIALVLNPQSSLFVLSIVPLFAVVSKHLIHIGFHRHVFNPAAFGLIAAAAVSSFLSSSLLSVNVISWWGVSFNSFTPLARVLGDFSSFATLPLWLAVAGAFIITSVRRWHVVFAFLAAHTALSAFSFVGAHVAWIDLPFVLKALLWDSTILFFVTVMLIEPMTSQFPKRWHRMSYAAGAGVGAWALGQTTIAGVFFDPLLGGLLLANMGTALLFLKRARQ